MSLVVRGPYRFRGPLLARPCKNCGDVFTTRDPRRRYCSLGCQRSLNNRDHYRRTREGA